MKSIVFKNQDQGKSKQSSFLIYSLEDPKNPLVKFINEDFE